MTIHRRRLLHCLALPALLTLTLGSAAQAAGMQGRVFTSSNAPEGNALMVYERAEDGALTLKQSVPTGGLGSGAGLGSQGAVTLSGDGRYLFVVNAASHTVSTLAVRHGALRLLSVVPTAGLHPISVAEHDGLVYVLNDQGEGNVAGFRNVGGMLKPIPGSVRGLSASTGTAPAQVGFSTDGDVLVVTEKGTNRITSYAVKRNGLLGPAVVTPSAGLTPFGFTFDARNHLIVTEAFGGAPGASATSSYRFIGAAPAHPLVLSASIGTTQAAACWVSATPDGRWAYVANTGSSSVSAYRIGSRGGLTLAAAVAASTGEGSAPADTAISADGRHLYVRNGGVLTISSFRIAADGTLAPAGLATDLPASAVGLAAN